MDAPAGEDRDDRSRLGARVRPDAPATDRIDSETGNEATAAVRERPESDPADAETAPELPTTISDAELAAVSPTVLWLTPDKPDDISVGRSRIADRLAAEGITVTVTGTTPATVLDALRHRGAYDVVVGTTRSGAIAGTLLSALTDTPLVVDHVDPIRQLAATNGTWLATLVRLLENVAFHRSDRTLFVYDEERPRVERYADAAWPTELGVDFERIANPSPAAVDAARDRLTDGHIAENVAIYVGGLEPIYHVEELLASVDHLENWTLLVLGTGSLAGTVERAAAATDAVVFPGSVPHEEIPGFMALADVGVCLVDDPRTLKVLEYGAAGVPVVHLDGRPRARFGDRLEYCEADPASVAAAIGRARDRDGDRLQSFVRHFTWDAIGTQYQRAIVGAVR